MQSHMYMEKVCSTSLKEATRLIHTRLYIIHVLYKFMMLHKPVFLRQTGPSTLMGSPLLVVC